MAEADEALSFSWGCQRFRTTTQEKPRAARRQEFPFALARFLHLVCRWCRDYILGTSQATDESKNHKKKKNPRLGYIKGGLFSKGPADRDTGVTCRRTHSLREAVLARDGRLARCTASA